jgi:hypothetical protein
MGTATITTRRHKSERIDILSGHLKTFTNSASEANVIPVAAREIISVEVYTANSPAVAVTRFNPDASVSSGAVVNNVAVSIVSSAVTLVDLTYRIIYERGSSAAAVTITQTHS